MHEKQNVQNVEPLPDIKIGQPESEVSDASQRGYNEQRIA